MLAIEWFCYSRAHFQEDMEMTGFRWIFLMI